MVWYGCVIQVVLLRNKWVEQLLVYFYNTAVENNFLIITSFSDFILSYNSKNRHLEFLNLSPQGLISSRANFKKKIRIGN